MDRRPSSRSRRSGTGGSRQRQRPTSRRRRSAKPPAITRREGSRRIRLLGALAVVGVALMIARAGWLGTVDSGWLSAVAASQQEKTVVSPGQRGAIVDRNGYELAFDRLSDTV